MSIDSIDIVQQFADLINANPNLTDAEKQQQIANYAASVGMPIPTTTTALTQDQIIAQSGSPIMGTSPDFVQGTADQVAYDTSLAADAQLATYADPSQVISPAVVNYGQGILPDSTAIPAVDSLQPTQNDYLTQDTAQSQYPLVDFAVEQQQTQSQYPSTEQPITENEYVPQWLSPFVQWVSTYNNPSTV